MVEAYKIVRFSALRKVIATRMAEAACTIPHFRVMADIQMAAMLKLRERENAANPDNKISINDCIVKASASALMQHPDINIQLHGEEIHQYTQADISIVIAVEGGLVTPVVQAADRKSVHDIATEIRSLAVRAAEKRLKMQEISGGSFSISNLGAHGVEQFDAIINPPQGAILALGCVKSRVVPAENGTAHVAQILRATLSVDHRAIDGTTAAAFMMTLRRAMEHPQAVFQ